MRGLEGAAEWLRPLVEARAWDYCVVWKLGDDPSRFIEWMGCCCSGGYGSGKVKDEKDEEYLICRDTYFQHSRRTKACEALSQFPSSMPLYSGIQGEVVISNQPIWLSNVNASDFNPSHDSSAGTRVLIPVAGGLIELFAMKHVPKDGKIIELIMAHCNFSLEQEAMTEQTYNNPSVNEQLIDLLSEDHIQNWPTSLPLLSFFPKLQIISPKTQSTSYLSFEGSSSSSNISNEKPCIDSFESYSAFLSPNGSLIQPMETSSFSNKHTYNDCPNVVQKETEKVVPKLGTGKNQSKNLFTERKRRNRIKDGLFALRSLVPKISKMDRTAILGDAIEYIQELQKKVKNLQDELRGMEEEDFTKVNNISTSERPEQQGSRCQLPIKHKQPKSNFEDKKHMQVQVEVSEIDKRNFLVKILCEHKRGGFTQLIEALDSLGLEIVDANVTTFHSKILNIFNVEANENGIQPSKLRDSLMKLTK